MRCFKCNSEVAEGMQFCPYCGSPMISQQQPQQPQQAQYQRPQQGQYQQPQQGQYQQPQQGQYQQPQQGQYQQPQQGQYQQPQQGQYQQPQQGQYQQPQQGQYQQPQQGQYQQPQQGQYRQPYQGQYQQPYRQQKPQLPHRPQLTFVEAINIASQRLTELEGRSRRSEFWWWYLAVWIGGIILSLIPYVGALVYLIQYGLLYSITIRRLNDVPAPEWFGKTYLGIYGAASILLLIWNLAVMNRVEFAGDLIYLIGDDTFGVLLALFMIGMCIGGIGLIYFGIKDSNPEIDPMHGPSPKYTL